MQFLSVRNRVACDGGPTCVILAPENLTEFQADNQVMTYSSRLSALLKASTQKKFQNKHMLYIFLHVYGPRVDMSSLPCDAEFGPRVDPSCCAFDLTLYFEDIFLSITPNVAFIFLLPVGLIPLFKNSSVIKSNRLIYLKAVWH